MLNKLLVVHKCKRDPQQVAQALQQVTQAKGDLNGNHNLQVAKDNANTAIDQLPNLNQPQKQH